MKNEVNGCGSKGAWIKIPNFIFKASCNKHDLYYNKGGNKHDRFVADYLFYKYMKEDVINSKWYKIPYYFIWATLYYESVRVFGKKHFNYK